MAGRKKQPTEQITKADLPRLQLSEVGYTGLHVSSGVPIEELKRELQYPQSITTFKQMTYHSTIAAALALYDMMVAKVEWSVKEIEKATEEDKKRSDFIRQCMNDMDHSWLSFIQEASSVKTFGFSVHEKVFRKRLFSKGSKYNDGLIGWKKLPIRSQDTIDKWYFSEDGRELIGCRQNTTYATSNLYSSTRNTVQIDLPRKKFLLFRTGKHKDNPYGRSCLRDCFYSWKYLTLIEEAEASGVMRDLSGLPVLYLPPQYMTEDATPEQKKIYAYYQNVMRNLQMNQQAGLILPQAFDPDTKNQLFNFKLMTAEGGKQYDTTKIKEFYKNSILTALFADLLIMGQGNTGSYALGSIKSNLMAVAIEALLKEICDVINNDLIRHTFELNNWPVDRMPTVVYDDFTEENLEEFSKAIQRISSTGMIERDREVMNKIRSSLGIDPYPADLPVQEDLLTGNSSRSGDSFSTPTGGLNGTANSVSTQDSSANNADNTA